MDKFIVDTAQTGISQLASRKLLSICHLKVKDLVNMFKSHVVSNSSTSSLRHSHRVTMLGE